MENHKVLVVFPESLGSKEKVSFMSTVFQEQYDELRPIIKSVQWKNKYYSIKLDLYVDEYETLESWIEEFSEEECIELKEVISGIIIVFNDNHKVAIDSISGIIEKMPNTDVAKFYIGCNFDSDIIEEQEINDINNDVMAYGLEVVNWFDASQKSGERTGSERIKEILDVHPWSNPHAAETNTPEQTIDSYDSNKDNTTHFDALLNRLQDARAKYLSLIHI